MISINKYTEAERNDIYASEESLMKHHIQTRKLNTWSFEYSRIILAMDI